jgi:flagellar motor protein MotB
LIDVMLESAVTAEAFPNEGRFCSITIVGHADRVDVAGKSPEDRRQLELENSTLRAESAEAFVFGEIFKRLSAQGFSAPVDKANMTNVEIQTIACGAADLIHKNPGNNLEQRKQNRRVQLVGLTFTQG